MPRKRRDLDDIINDYIPGKMHVIYSAYEGYEDEEEDIPKNNLNEVAAKGRVVLVGQAEEFYGGKESKDYRSKVLVDPTWLVVAIHANAMIKRTRDLHHVFLEGIEEKGVETTADEGKVTVYEFCMGS